MPAVAGALTKPPPIHWVETQIARPPAYLALTVFLILVVILLPFCCHPAAILLPLRLAALWLIAHGNGVLGAFVSIVAKIIGAAFLARTVSLASDKATRSHP